MWEHRGGNCLNGDSVMLEFMRGLFHHNYIALPSYYKIEGHFFRTGRQNAPKFCTHVRMDTLTLKTLKKWTHTTPGG